MSVSAQLATVLLVAIHLAAAFTPCPTPKLPAHEANFGTLAEAHPCPVHPETDDSHSTWFDSLCPCGCQSGTAPGSGPARIGPALLVAEFVPVGARDCELRIPSPPQRARFAPAPPDHVPLIA